MSASREKKQRQTTPDTQFLSPKAQEELKKEQLRKRNTIVYTIIGIVAVILVAALLIWNTGIFQRNATAATIGGEKVTASQVGFYYYRSLNAVQNTAYTLSQFGMGTYYDSSVSPREQVITEEAATQLSTYASMFGSSLSIGEEYVGQTYHEYCLDSALNSLRQELALVAAAKQAGYALSDSGKETIEANLASIDDSRSDYQSQYGTRLSRTAYLKLIYGDLMTESLYKKCLENAQLASEYYNNVFDAVSLYSEDELDAYYQDNKDDLDSYSFSYQFFSGTASSTIDEDGNTVEPTEAEQTAAMNQARRDARSALSAVKADASLTEEDDYTTETGVVGYNVKSVYSDWADWLIDSARRSGDAELFETETGFYVVAFTDRSLIETPTVNVRHILVSAMPEDDPETADVDESAEDPSADDYAAAKTEAERILAEWQAGGGTEESFAALAEQYSADSGSNTNGGLYENVYEGQMISTFNDWIFAASRKSGDTGIVQNTESTIKGWHIIYFVGEDNPVWKINAAGNKWADDLEASTEIIRAANLDSLLG